MAGTWVRVTYEALNEGLYHFVARIDGDIKDHIFARGGDEFLRFDYVRWLDGEEEEVDRPEFSKNEEDDESGSDHYIFLRQRAIIQVANFLEATSQLAQTTLRAVLGKHELDELLAEREKLNLDIQTVLDAATDAWGIKVSTVEIKHVDLNESMVRAIAQQAEAERARRAKVIHAEGEQQAAEFLVRYAALRAGQQPPDRAQSRPPPAPPDSPPAG